MLVVCGPPVLNTTMNGTLSQTCAKNLTRLPAASLWRPCHPMPERRWRTFKIMNVPWLQSPQIVKDNISIRLQIRWSGSCTADYNNKATSNQQVDDEIF